MIDMLKGLAIMILLPLSADAIQDAHAERCSWMETPPSARAI
jgi:hypothetical protein